MAIGEAGVAWLAALAGLCGAPTTQTLSHLRLRLATAITRPTERCALPDGVSDIQPRAALDQEPHNRLVAAQAGRVQWRRVRMVAVCKF
jgi:hypothetical protein